MDGIVAAERAGVGDTAAVGGDTERPGNPEGEAAGAGLLAWIAELGHRVTLQRRAGTISARPHGTAVPADDTGKGSDRRTRAGCPWHDHRLGTETPAPASAPAA